MGFEERNGAGRTTDPAATARGRGVADLFSAFLKNTSDAATSLADVYGDRLRLSTKETAWKLGVGTIVGVATLLWVGSSTLAAARGLRGAVTFFAGEEAWLGDLAGGLLALALAAGGVAIAARWSNRSQLRALEQKYARHDTKSSAANTPPVPGSPAGAGDATAPRGVQSAR